MGPRRADARTEEHNSARTLRSNPSRCAGLGVVPLKSRPPAVDGPFMQRYRPILERVAAGVVLSLMFLLMASVFVPEPSLAHTDNGVRRGGTAESVEPIAPRNAIDAVTVESAHASLTPLGVLEAGPYRIQIMATEDGPRYTVRRTADDAVLGLLLTPWQVEERFPTLPLPNLDFSANVDNEDITSIR